MAKTYRPKLFAEIDGQFTAHDLKSLGDGRSYSAALKLIQDWEARKYIRFVRIARDQRRYYEIVDPEKDLANVPLSATDVASPEGNMWRAMGFLKTFTPLDIAAHSNAGGVSVSEDDAQTYCRHLLAADYLTVVDRAIIGRRAATYRLVKNSGPAAPRPLRVRGLHDPNTGQFIPADRALRP